MVMHGLANFKFKQSRSTVQSITSLPVSVSYCSHATTLRERSKFESLLQAGPCELKIVPLVILVRKFPGIQRA